MYIANIKENSIENGYGVRCSVFVSGCKNHCKGCFQPETWCFKYGSLYTKETEDQIIEMLKKKYCAGLTILGGEPFELENQPGVYQLIERVISERKKNPTLAGLSNIWMYTGYTYDKDLIKGGCRYSSEYTDKILNNIDILVDGKFEEELKDISLSFRGSSNQRIIDMKASRKYHSIVLLNTENSLI